MTAQAHQPPSGLRVAVRLYVAGDAPNSTLAVSNLQSVLRELDTEVDLEIVDVLRDPERGLSDGVLVTPMLVRSSPQPERRLLGNLRDRALLRGVLSLGPASDE